MVFGQLREHCYGLWAIKGTLLRALGHYENITLGFGPLKKDYSGLWAIKGRLLWALGH